MNATYFTPQSSLRKQGEVSSMPAFSSEDFKGVGLSRRKDTGYPQAIVQKNGVTIKTSFSAAEYAEAFPERAIPKTQDGVEGLEITYPSKMFASEGDRYPSPVSEVVEP